MTRLPNLFELFLNEMHISITKITIPVNSTADFPDMGLRSYFYGGVAPFYDSLPEMIWSETGPAKIYMMQDQYHCRYILSAIGNAPGQCWLVGPYLTSEPTRQNITTLCKKLGHSEGDKRFVHIYYKMLPKLLDENMTEALFRTQAALHYSVRGFEMVPWDMGDKVSLTNEPVGAGSVLVQRKHLEQTYAIESRMMECISQGNYQGALTLFSRLKRNGLDSKTGITLRDAKNSLLVLNVLCRVSGYNGDVHPDQLDQLSRSFILKIEGTTSMTELLTLRDAMIRKYCAAARKKSDARYNPIIQKVVDSMTSSFHTNLTLNGLARQFNVSPSYLSTLFKKETGQSFTEYLTQKRLSFAKKLLRETDLPINVIATECGIADNNYFARIFKTHEGMTPAHYRTDKRYSAPSFMRGK